MRAHCEQFLKLRGLDEITVPMRTPPLFRDKTNVTDKPGQETLALDEREGIKKELETGATGFFLLRSIKKHGLKAVLVLTALVVIPKPFAFVRPAGTSTPKTFK